MTLKTRLRLWWIENGPCVVIVAALLVLAAVLGVLGACTSKAEAKPQDPWPEGGKRTIKLPGGVEINAEPGAPIDISVTEKSEGVGPGVRTDASEVVASMDLSAPLVMLDHATGGGIVYTMKLTGASQGVLIVYGLGAALCLGGVLIGWLGKSVPAGVAVFGAGVAVILLGRAIEAYPWIGLLIPVVLIAAGVYVLIEIRHGRVNGIALGTVVRSIEAVNGHGEPVKEQVKVIAGANRPLVDAAVKRAKRKEGLA